MSNILTDAGRAAILGNLKNKELFCAWGIGNVGWDTSTTPPFPTNQLTLLSELGRQRIVSKQWVIVDGGGSIVVGGTHYSLAGGPTNHLYLHAIFSETSEPTASIREVAVLQDVTVNPSISLGQQYFHPADVTVPGTLLIGSNFAKVIRASTKREHFEFVITL